MQVLQQLEPVLEQALLLELELELAQALVQQLAQALVQQAGPRWRHRIRQRR